MNIDTQMSELAPGRRGSLDHDSAAEQPEDHADRRQSRQDCESPSLRWYVMWLVVIGLALVLLAGGCSNEAQLQTGGGVTRTKSKSLDCVASGKRLSAEEIKGLSQAELDRAIMSPFTVRTYEQSRKRQWVLEARDADRVLAKNERPTEPR